MKDSLISWTDNTFNLWRGCTKVSCGCRGCYAEHYLAIRLQNTEWGEGKPRIRCSEELIKEVYKWQEEAKAANKRVKVFSASMSDVFDEEVPDAWRDELFAIINATPNLDWQLLTKRAEKAVKYASKITWPANAWIGVTVETQDYVKRAELIKQIPAPVRFLSMEPLLGPVQLDLTGIDWVIVGGESGPNYRPPKKDWFVDIRDQCEQAKVPFFFKQWGGIRPDSNGHLLDGKEYHNFPVPKPERLLVKPTLAEAVKTVEVFTEAEKPEKA